MWNTVSLLVIYSPSPPLYSNLGCLLTFSAQHPSFMNYMQMNIYYQFIT
uniref:Uncharacterized protein n=1 Tax=Meloidogyne enterolobii TaxID=390850 RepID=A0A6V7VG43_MELEN|nr:unnamed protein product [Meloidogyne enterolobii]